MQNCSNASVLAMELLHFCTKPSLLRYTVRIDKGLTKRMKVLLFRKITKTTTWENMLLQSYDICSRYEKELLRITLPNAISISIRLWEHSDANVISNIFWRLKWNVRNQKLLLWATRTMVHCITQMVCKSKCRMGINIAVFKLICSWRQILILTVTTIGQVSMLCFPTFDHLRILRKFEVIVSYVTNFVSTLFATGMFKVMKI